MVLAFAAACLSTAAYSGLVEAYPITVIESLWGAVALQRFLRRSREEKVLAAATEAGVGSA